MNSTKSREVEAVARAIFCQYDGPPVEVTVEDNCLMVKASVSFHAERKGQRPVFGQNQKIIGNLLRCIADKDSIRFTVDIADVDMEIIPPEQLGGRVPGHFSIDINNINDKKLARAEQSLLRAIRKLHTTNKKLFGRLVRIYGIPAESEMIVTESLRFSPSLIQITTPIRDEAKGFVDVLNDYGVGSVKICMADSGAWKAVIEISNENPEGLEDQLRKALDELKQEKRHTLLDHLREGQYRNNVQALTSIIDALNIPETITVSEKCGNMTRYEISFEGQTKAMAAEQVAQALSTQETIEIVVIPDGEKLKMLIDAEMKQYPTSPSGKIRLVPCSPRGFGRILAKIQDDLHSHLME